MVPGAGPGDTATGPLAVVGAVEAVRSTNAKDTSAVTPAWCSEKSLAKVTAVDGPLPVMDRGPLEVVVAVVVVEVVVLVAVVVVVVGTVYLQTNLKARAHPSSRQAPALFSVIDCAFIATHCWAPAAPPLGSVWSFPLAGAL